MGSATGQPDLEGLAREINTEHAAVEASLTAGLAHALRTGELLMEAKKLLAHGRWLPWLAGNCKFSQRTAQAYMRLASRRPELEAKSATRCAFENVSFRQGLKLLADGGEDSREKELTPGEAALEKILRPDSQFIPSAGCLFWGEHNNTRLIIAHSERHNGYCFVIREDNKDDDGLIVETRERPIRNDFIEWALHQLDTDYRSFEWIELPAAPWPYNFWETWRQREAGR